MTQNFLSESTPPTKMGFASDAEVHAHRCEFFEPTEQEHQ